MFTKNSLNLASSFTDPSGNGCVGGYAYGTTTGLNFGGSFEAINGNQNVGIFGKSVTAKANAINIGVIGSGRNSNATAPIEVGVFAYIGTADNPTIASTALLVDNGSATDPILLARDNGTEKFRIADGGFVGIGTTTTTYGLNVAEDVAIPTVGKTYRQHFGSTGDMFGDVALTAGVGTITITGLTTSDRAFTQIILDGGTLGVRYTAVCTANTLTITSETAAGATQILDTSTITYHILRPN